MKDHKTFLPLPTSRRAPRRSRSSYTLMGAGCYAPGPARCAKCDQPFGEHDLWRQIAIAEHRGSVTTITIYRYHWPRCTPIKKVRIVQ